MNPPGLWSSLTHQQCVVWHDAVFSVFQHPPPETTPVQWNLGAFISHSRWACTHSSVCCVYKCDFIFIWSRAPGCFSSAPQATASARPLWKREISTAPSPATPVVPVKGEQSDPQHLWKPVIQQKDVMTLLSGDTSVYPLYCSIILSDRSPWRRWHPYLLLQRSAPPRLIHSRVTPYKHSFCVCVSVCVFTMILMNWKQVGDYNWFVGFFKLLI